MSVILRAFHLLNTILATKPTNFQKQYYDDRRNGYDIRNNTKLIKIIAKGPVAFKVEVTITE